MGWNREKRWWNREKNGGTVRRALHVYEPQYFAWLTATKCEIHDLRARFHGSNPSRHFCGILVTPFHQDFWRGGAFCFAICIPIMSNHFSCSFGVPWCTRWTSVHGIVARKALGFRQSSDAGSANRPHDLQTLQTCACFLWPMSLGANSHTQATGNGLRARFHGSNPSRHFCGILVTPFHQDDVVHFTLPYVSQSFSIISAAHLVYHDVLAELLSTESWRARL